MKVKEYEVKQMIKAKERQAVFEQVFEADIQQYKTSGILPSKLEQYLVVVGTNSNKTNLSCSYIKKLTHWTLI